MLRPSVRLISESGVLVADFWDCLRLDPATVRELRTLYEKRVDHGEAPHLLVDLNGVSFAGSAALSGFVTLQRSCRQRGGRLVFCEIEATVLESFRVSRLLPLFQIIVHREDGLASLGVDWEGESTGVGERVARLHEVVPATVPPIHRRRRPR